MAFSIRTAIESGKKSLENVDDQLDASLQGHRSIVSRFTEQMASSRPRAGAIKQSKIWAGDMFLRQFMIQWNRSALLATSDDMSTLVSRDHEFIFSSAS